MYLKHKGVRHSNNILLVYVLYSNSSGHVIKMLAIVERAYRQECISMRIYHVFRIPNCMGINLRSFCSEICSLFVKYVRFFADISALGKFVTIR